VIFLEQEVFSEALSKVNVPVLVLDQKWHRLFALDGKPDAVKDLEKEINGYLARQGKLNQELKELKKVKNSLMQNIVENMDSPENAGNEAVLKKREEDKRLIEEVNQKLADNEDELLEIPKLIRDANQNLMLETMNFCYNRLRTNYREAEEIAEWIKQVRIELKKNIIRKQNREINNKEIYAYMHDIFGKDVIDLFDVKNNDVDLTTGEDRPTGDTSDDRTLNESKE
jgi:hypothetical protein